MTLDISSVVGVAKPAQSQDQIAAHRAYVLGQRHSADGVGELLGYLKSPSPNVRRLASSAFEKIADLSFDKRLVAKELVGIAYGDSHSQVRQYALKALKGYVEFLWDYRNTILSVSRDSAQKDYVRNAAKNVFDRIMAANASRDVAERPPVPSVAANAQQVLRQCEEPDPSYREIVSRPDRYLKGEQLIAWTAKTTSPVLIKGGAGSGKTIVAMLRAIYARKMSLENLFGEGRVACLTFDSLLNREIGVALAGSNVAVMTVDSWVYRYLKALGDDLAKKLPNDQGAYRVFDDCFRRAWTEVFSAGDKRAVASKGRRFYNDEFEWMKGRAIETLEDYLQADRAGRGSEARFGAEDRKLVWKLKEAYERLYTEAKHETFEDRVLRAWHLIQKRGIPEELTYDHVVIDEAQDFTYVKLRIVVEMTRGKTQDEKGLTLVADVAQEIYQSGFSWKDANIAVQGGRTRPFKKNYRNTKQIAAAAYSLMEHEQDREEMTEMVLPIREGPIPQVWTCGSVPSASSQDTMREKMREAIERSGGTKVVAAFTTAEIKGLREYFARQGFMVNVNEPIGRGSIDLFADVPQVKGLVHLRTLHHMKGLQFDHVFLWGMDGQRFRNVPGDEKSDSVYRKLMYVGMTRACRTLTICCPWTPSKFVEEIDPALVERKVF